MNTREKSIFCGTQILINKVQSLAGKTLSVFWNPNPQNRMQLNLIFTTKGGFCSKNCPRVSQLESARQTTDNFFESLIGISVGRHKFVMLDKGKGDALKVDPIHILFS